MTYEYITEHDSPNYWPSSSVPAKYGQKRVVKSITVHWWNDPRLKPTFNGTVSYLCRNGGNSSAHYVAEAGRVACIVSPKHAAWHSGSSTGNATSVGIEMNPRMSKGDIETLVELIADLRKVYGKIPIVGHRDWSATTCPGSYYAELDEIRKAVVELEAKRAGTKPVANPVKPSKPKPSKPETFNAKPIQRAVRTKADGIWGRITDDHVDALREASNYGGADFPYGVRYAQAVVGTKQDGVWGPKSRRAHDKTVKTLQRALKKAGLYMLKIDGIWGAGTEAAVKRARAKARA